MLELKKKYARLDKAMLNKLIDSKCNWLFLNYTNLFNKLKKNELNLKILGYFIDTLKEIEDGKLDQHVASVKIGEILKKLYIDSALQHKEKLENSEKRKKKNVRRAKKISWSQFKEQQLQEE